MVKSLVTRLGFALLVIAVVLIVGACGGGGSEEQVPSDATTDAVKPGSSEQEPSGGAEPVKPGTDSAEAAAQRSFDSWAKERGTPYRDPEFTVLESDGVFADVRLVVDLRDSADSDWEECEAEIECRKVGDEWQCDYKFDFQWTEAQWQRKEEQDAATATARAATATARSATATAEAAEEAARVLNVWYVPSGPPDTTGPSALADLLLAETGLEAEVSGAQSFAEVREGLCSGQVDVGVLNTFYYLPVHDECGADASLTVVRSGSSAYKSQIIVRADSGITSVADLKGKTMCWVDPRSTSGYIVPRIMLLGSGIDPDADFSSTVETGSHSHSVVSVYRGGCDAAGVYVDARSAVLDDLPDVMDVVTVLAISADVPNESFVFSREVPAEVRDKVVDGLLAVAASDEGQGLLQQIFYAEGLTKVDDSLFESFRGQVIGAGMNFEDLVE
jgi:phosphonate transport system substrate-binding protein